MKTKTTIFAGLLTFVLAVAATGLMAQGPYPQTGAHTVCIGATKSYGVIETAGSSYAWSINPPTAGSITVGATPNLISVEWLESGTHTVMVIETNADNCAGSAQTVAVTVVDLPVPVITGPISVCEGSTGVTYTTEAGMSAYDWVISAGGTITGGSGTNEITVTWNTAGPQTLSVNYTNGDGCQAATPTELAVTVLPTPVLVITNPDAVCAPGTVDLTAAAVTAGSTLPSGTTLSYWEDASATIAIADPTAVAASGTYYIKAETASAPACEDIAAVMVTIHEAPVLVITNPAAVCAPGTVDLTDPDVTAGSTLPSGTTLTYWEDASATTPIADPTAVAASGTYYIRAETATTPACVDIAAVVVNINPSPTPSITGDLTVCVDSDITYFTVENVGNTYLWEVVGGNFVGSATGHSVVVNWTVVSDANSITVTETAGACQGTDTKTVSVKARPTTSVIYHD